jgi:tRNA modification GTPase
MPAENDNRGFITAQGEFPLSRFAYAACATPPGTSGLAVIRMAGTGAFEIADALFKSCSPKSVSVHAMNGYTCAYGVLSDPASGDLIDTVVLTKFTAPNSYTGEDTIEISCHGGTSVKNAVLDALFALGARPAEPGEFTKHAFLNGKIDLSQAEAVMDLIGATARRADMEATRQLQGALSVKVREISRAIYTVMAGVEMMVEFPEHEETPEAIDGITSRLRDIAQDVDILAESFRQGRILREGMKVVIAGRPNTGKSSMLNTLSGIDRAIVTPTPGTTRDTIEALVEIEGIPVHLIDTAGLRDSDDEVEKKGIDRTRQAIDEADLVFWISSDPRTDENALPDPEEEDLREILSIHPDKSLVLILGKSDRTSLNKNSALLRAAFPNAPVIPYSSVTLEGVHAIRELIRDRYEAYGAASGEVLITNARHFLAVSEAKKSLGLAIEGIASHLPVDLLASALRSAADALACITGDAVSEEVVNEIFSRFCIGK